MAGRTIDLGCEWAELCNLCLSSVGYRGQVGGGRWQVNGGGSCLCDLFLGRCFANGGAAALVGDQSRVQESSGIFRI